MSCTVRHAAQLRAVSLALLSAVLAGQDPLQALLQQVDTDRDGVVSRAEFPGSDEQFAAADRDRNGKLTLAELQSSALGKRLQAAERSAALPPRARVALDELALARLMHLARWDPSGDGRVTRAEWTGDPLAFTTLDLDGNGVLDGADKALAQRRLAATTKTEPAPPPLNTALPSTEELFARYDKNQDQLLAKAELAGSKLAPLFAYADRNRDLSLDRDEVRRLVETTAQGARQRDQGAERPRAYEVPFSTWDRNKDGRLEANEFVEQQQLFVRIDHNRDSVVTKAEIVRYTRAVEGVGFVGKFDLDGDETVSLAEFAGPTDAFRRADRNGDGVVSAADR